MSEPAEVDEFEPLRDRGDELLERFRVAARVDEDPVVPHLASHRHQRMLPGCQSFEPVAVGPAGIRRAHQSAIQPVGPLVVGTHDVRHRPASLRHQAVAAMATGVVKGANAIRCAPHEKIRHSRYIPRIADAREIRSAPDEEPGATEPTFMFQREELPRPEGDAGKAAAESARIEDAVDGPRRYEVGQTGGHFRCSRLRLWVGRHSGRSRPDCAMPVARCTGTRTVPQPPAARKGARSHLFRVPRALRAHLPPARRIGVRIR